jgi:multidrug resistance efflux pump
MSSLPPIPRSAAQRWREFRFKGLPTLSFLTALIAVIILWKTTWIPAAFVGEVQSTEIIVKSPQAGAVVELAVEDFQRVTTNQVLARVLPKSPDVATAQIAAMKTDLEVMRVRMTQDQNRNDLGYEQARVDLQVRRLELASAQIRLQQAESELQRMSRLFEDKLVPQGVTEARNQFGYDVALRDRDVLRKEVEDKTQIVAELEKTLGQLRVSDVPGRNPAVAKAIDAAIAAQEKLLEETLGAVTLRAPLNGMVKKVVRHAGENVIAGDPILELGSDAPERIIGFLRQPISYHPKDGDVIEVRTRGTPSQKGTARVIRVGSQLQLFTQPLRVRGLGAAMERGLPVLLTVPTNLTVLPGESVDLIPQKLK